ncbi:MAG TPA: hypothetical protein VGS20_07655 [Candidatus Acidoferrales bacterium]|nr:hypothetical protein [Candidatus Acidoferrales bacterium]
MRPAKAAAAPVPGGARLLQRMFTRLGCQGRPPRFVAEFYPYANLGHTLRFRGEAALVRLSDLLSEAPLPILEAAAALLLARAYRIAPPREWIERYRRYCHTPRIRRQLCRLRRRRCPPLVRSAARYDLDVLFERLNRRYFASRLHRPQLGWSRRLWRVQMGSFDATLDRIVLNRRLDRAGVPRFAVEYVLFHEMLHVKHPGRMARCGLQVHSRAFREEETTFRHYAEARRWLERLR